MASQTASGPLVSDQLWELLEPLRPPPPPTKNGRTGRPRIDDRAALEGILFVAETGFAWKKLPTDLGFGSGITCWRRLRAWQDLSWLICLVREFRAADGVEDGLLFGGDVRGEGLGRAVDRDGR